jgi:hypothetical protein
LQIIGGSELSINVSIVKQGNVSLDLYSLSGRLVQSLASGYREKVLNRFICKMDGFKCVYFVRATTPDGMAVNKVVIK